MENQEVEEYEKEMTPFYKNKHEEITYSVCIYQKYPKEERIAVKELEEINVLDVNRYKKHELKEKIGDFVVEHNYLKLKKRIM